MFKKLLEIISSKKGSKTEQIDSNIIFASLLVRAARIDNEYSDVEKQQIDLIIKDKFLVPISKAQEIRTHAEEFEQNIVDTVQITKKIKKHILPIESVIFPKRGAAIATNKKRITEVCKAFAVDTVYHAAAYKHVPLVEENPFEGVFNNIIGTQACVQAAIDAEVESFVLISLNNNPPSTIF